MVQILNVLITSLAITAFVALSVAYINIISGGTYLITFSWLMSQQRDNFDVYPIRCTNKSIGSSTHEFLSATILASTCPLSGDQCSEYFCNSTGFCDLIKRNETVSCFKDGDCEENEVCNKKTCSCQFAPDVALCTNKEECGKILDTQCLEFDCVDSQCIRKKKDNVVCASNADCGVLQFCSDTCLCQENPASLCTLDSDCSRIENTTCQTVSCIGGSCTLEKVGECAFSADCIGASQFCNSNCQCQFRNTSYCESSIDCGDITWNTCLEYSCTSNACEQTIIAGAACAISGDCGELERCNSTCMCETFPDSYCETDTQCYGISDNQCVSYTCVSNSCQRGTIPSASCSQNIDCPIGEYCSLESCTCFPIDNFQCSVTSYRCGDNEDVNVTVTLSMPSGIFKLVDEDYALVISESGDANATIIDISSPTAITQVSGEIETGNLWDCDNYNSTIVICTDASTSSIVVIDVTTPSSPTIVSTTDISTMTTQVYFISLSEALNVIAITGATTPTHIFFFDISDLNSITTLHNITTSNYTETQIRGERLYAMDFDQDMFVVFNISDVGLGMVSEIGSSSVGSTNSPYSLSLHPSLEVYYSFTSIDGVTAFSLYVGNGQISLSSISVETIVYQYNQFDFPPGSFTTFSQDSFFMFINGYTTSSSFTFSLQEPLNPLIICEDNIGTQFGRSIIVEQDNAYYSRILPNSSATEIFTFTSLAPLSCFFHEPVVINNEINVVGDNFIIGEQTSVEYFTDQGYLQTVTTINGTFDFVSPAGSSLDYVITRQGNVVVVCWDSFTSGVPAPEFFESEAFIPVGLRTPTLYTDAIPGADDTCVPPCILVAVNIYVEVRTSGSILWQPIGGPFTDSSFGRFGASCTQYNLL